MFDAEFSELDEREVSDEARVLIHGRMCAQARAAPVRLAEWVRTVDPTNSHGASRLADVYEALAPDAASFEAFFIGELDRLVSVCEAHPSSKPAFNAIGALMFLEGDPESLWRTLRDRLIAGLRSSSASVRRACVDLLGGHDFGRDAAARAAIEGALRDGDWKVRALAESALSSEGLLPPGYSTPLIDRLRRKMFSWVEYV